MLFPHTGIMAPLRLAIALKNTDTNMLQFLNLFLYEFRTMLFFISEIAYLVEIVCFILAMGLQVYLFDLSC